MRNQDMAKCTVDSCKGDFGVHRGKYLTQNENGQRTDKEWTKVTKVLQLGSAEIPNSSLLVFCPAFLFALAIVFHIIYVLCSAKVVRYVCYLAEYL